MFAKRPKRGEDDEDLQKFQEEFLSSSANVPSAKVVRVNRPAEETTEDPHHPGEAAALKEKESEDIQPDDKPMDVDVSKLLSNVVEKKNVSAFLRSFNNQSVTSLGFPAVSKLPVDLLRPAGDSSANAHPKGKKSLFMQQLEAKKRKAAQDKPDSETQSAAAEGGDGKGELSAVRAGDMGSMMTEISQENEQKLAGMTEEEVFAEQQEIASMLDPRLLQLLKHRKSKKVFEEEPKPDSSSSASRSFMDVAVADDRQGTTGFQKDEVAPIKSGDLPFEPDDRWLHMDRLEHEKLRWLRPLDEHKSKRKNTKEKVSARFDFNGDLINPDLDIDTKSGLHHHGDEPGAAGYTLEELYILVRSLNASQKTLALSSLANVISKAMRGDYIYLLNSSVVKSLLDADLVLLLRYALDERSDLVVAAAVNAWHSLLYHQQDMLALSTLHCSLYGNLVPELSPPVAAPPETEEEEIEREEEQYLEILKRDTVSGLLLMDFLPRLRYILEVVRPQQKVCSQILDVISRMVITSSEVAYKVSRTPRLISCIFEEFLPMSFTPLTGDEDNAHGKPLAEAMRVVRFFCASGRNMAASFMAERCLMDRIIRYLSSDDSELGSGHQELIVESLLTWRTLVLYGLGLDHYHILHASLVTRLQQEKNVQISSSLVCLLSAFLSSAATEQPNKKTVSFSDETAAGATPNPPSQLEWTHVAGLIDSVYGLAIRDMNLFISTYADEYATFPLAGLVSSLDFVGLYLAYARTQAVHLECSVTPQTITEEFAELIARLLTSAVFRKLLSSIRKYSILLNDGGYLTSETPDSLPSLCSVAKPANTPEERVADSGVDTEVFIQQILALKSLVRILTASLRVCPAKIQPICQQLIEHNETLTYIRQIIQSTAANFKNYFSFVECSTLADICQLAASIPTSCTKVVHKLGLTLVSKCTSSTLAELHELFGSVICSQTLFRSYEDSDGSESADQLYKECIMSLPSISNTYISLMLPMGEKLQRARYLATRDTHRALSMLVEHRSEDLLPTDWPFMPIMHLYQTSNTRVAQPELPPDTGLLLKNTLQFICLLEKYVPDLISSIGPHAKIARVMCTFLLDNDLFLETHMQILLDSLLRSYCRSISRIKFDQPIPGLHSFSDLYLAFIDQFEATSFGNDVFSQYLLLPMMQEQPVTYRKSVWTEHGLTLRSLMISPEQLVFPVETLLYPEESDTSIIISMCRHLLAGTITPRRNSLIYIIAVHHVNRFMFTTDGQEVEMKTSLLKTVHRCTVEPVKTHLLFYKEYRTPGVCMETSSSEECGIICYSKLPASRCNTLTQAELS